MIRHVAALAVALCLSPVWLAAQTPVLTVNAASADVYKSPSTGSPVIGRAPKGTVIAVTRDLGSWVKVAWPDAPDGVGYVHVKMGSLGTGAPSEPSRPAVLTSALPAPEAAPLTPVAVVAERPAPVATSAALSSVYVTPATHRLGLGGRMGNSTLGFGASARAWNSNRLGLQIEMSRYAISTVDAGQVTSMQFAPSLIYSLPDRVTDFVWVRPYVGSGINVRHQTLSSATPSLEPSVSENKFGLQFFGGGELTFAGLPPFALSVELAYHRATAFAGVDLGGLGISVAGHWYVR